jgi:hypothetical protein
MECPNCKNQLKDTAKFCGKCGTKIEQPAEQTPSSTPENQCVECGNPLKSGAKFCGKCGKPQPTNAQPQQSPPNENAMRGFITWEMQPGQVALRLTESIFSQYTRAQGVVIPEGFMVMVLNGGKLQAMVEAGIYRFDKRSTDLSSPLAGIAGFFSNLFKGRKKNDPDKNQQDAEAISQAVHKRVPVEIIVCRSSDFALPFTIKEVPTKAIKVDAGLLVSVQISNLLELYKRFMIDKTALASETFANELTPYIETAVKETLTDFAPENINTNGPLKATLNQKLESVFKERFPYIQFIDVVKIETAREELQRLEQLSEEMYLSERELEQLSRRNEFMNRLSQEQNNAELQNATNSAEFNRQLAEINRDNLITQEEMENFQRDINERAENHEFDRARAMELMVVQHQHDMQSAQIRMEEELGTRLFNLQLDRKRQEDQYADERRRKEMEIDKEEQLGQLDLLRQAQDIRQQREEAEHNRKLEEKKQEQTFEMDKLNVYKGMSAEQIMVANPNITAEAAKAMAEKFKAEAAEIAHDSRASDAQNQMQMMKEFMEQQMQAVRDMSAANAQALSGAMGAKEREIERTQHMMDKNEDRYASVVRENIKAGNNPKGSKVCSSCGQKTEEESFCPDCGNRLDD